MISDKNLKILSLCISLIGIAVIYLVSVLTGNTVIKISEITDSDTGRHVVINGTVTSFTTSNGNIFMEINDNTGNIMVVMFERTARGQDIYKFKENDAVLVNGQVNIYKDELEIIANSVKPVGS